MAQNEKKPTSENPSIEKKKEKDKAQQKILVTKDGKFLTHNGKILVVNASKEKDKEKDGDKDKNKGKKEENE